jgi:hypothetical protein
LKKITINDVKVSANKIECQYSISDGLKKYFTKYPFFVEYSKPIINCTKSVAVIPLLCQLLPISWLLDVEIILQEVDFDFYSSIPNIKKGYEIMYPKIQFKGKLTVGKLVQYSYKKTDIYEKQYESVVFFSGGVDSYHTLLHHVAEKPILTTIWGSDIDVANTVGWKKVEEHITQTALTYSLDSLTIRSSFRKIINSIALTGEVYKYYKETWWHGFQHGIGIIGHIAPFVACTGIKNTYIAATYTQLNDGKCASHPSIDGFTDYCGCKTHHDGFEFERHEKVTKIINFSNHYSNKVNLRVCWESSKGTNCNKCEKCIRTILEIYAAGYCPKDYGFNYSEKDFPKIINKLHILLITHIIPHFAGRYYIIIQQLLKNNYNIDNSPSFLKWLYTYDFKLYTAGKRTNLEKLLYIPFAIYKMYYILHKMQRKYLKKVS